MEEQKTRKASLLLSRVFSYTFGTRNRLVQALTFLLVVTSTLLLVKRSVAGGLLDLAPYNIAGSEILSGKNPYLSGYRSGPIGALFIHIVIEIFGIKVGELFFLFATVAGLFGFGLHHFRQSSSIKQLFLFLIVLWASPTRELLLNHQLTGVCLALASMGLIQRNSKTRKFNSLLLGITKNLLLIVAIDLKPHIVLPFIFCVFLFQKSLKLLFIVIASYLSTLLVLSLLIAVNLPYSQLLVIRGINGNHSADKLNDISNFWTIMNYYFGNSHVFYNLAIFLSASLLIAIARNAWLQNSKLTVILVAIFPAISIYCHLYDFGILTFLIAHLIVNFPEASSRIASLLTLLIPFNAINLPNSIFLSMATLFTLRMDLFQQNSRIRIAEGKRLLFSLTLYFTVIILEMVLTQDSAQINSRIVTFVCVLGLILVTQTYRKINLDNFFRLND